MSKLVIESAGTEMCRARSIVIEGLKRDEAIRVWEPLAEPFLRTTVGHISITWDDFLPDVSS